jgi:hypothetical protein
MEYFVICTVAFLVSGLTLFSGFGLGTVLMPTFALFFPTPVAIAATAVVHLANNLFKVALVGRKADRGVVLRFAVPGALAAVAGAAILGIFAGAPSLFTYTLFGQSHEVTLVNLVIGVLIIGFALLDLLPHFSNLAFGRKYLGLGGVLSGFFGGLSGNQGALRSAFLIKSGLDKEAFIGTSTVSAVVVDVARLLVYGFGFYIARFSLIGAGISGLVLAATVAAFLGAFLGTRLLKKITLRSVQLIVGVMLIVVGAGMATGLI